MAFDESGKIWMDGELVDWKDAKIHVLSHVVNYGTDVFEGIRAYEIDGKAQIFRLEDHVKRLFDSAKIYKMDIPFTQEEICEAIKETIKANNLTACYIRPIVYRGYKELGVSPVNCPVNVAIAVWEWGAYLGEEGMANGVNIGVSSWRKPAVSTFPNIAKAGANYMLSQLANMEAKDNGFDEGLLLDVNGNIAEGPGENVFLVLDGKIYTPTLSSSLLKGITRDSVIKLAGYLGYEVNVLPLPRDLLYIADEMFFAGTAAEVTPIRSMDHRIVGEGKRGPVTEKIQREFFKIVNGEVEDRYGWFSPVD